MALTFNTFRCTEGSPFQIPATARSLFGAVNVNVPSNSTTWAAAYLRMHAAALVGNWGILESQPPNDLLSRMPGFTGNYLWAQDGQTSIATCALLRGFGSQPTGETCDCVPGLFPTTDGSFPPHGQTCALATTCDRGICDGPTSFCSTLPDGTPCGFGSECSSGTCGPDECNQEGTALLMPCTVGPLAGVCVGLGFPKVCVPVADVCDFVPDGAECGSGDFCTGGSCEPRECDGQANGSSCGVGAADTCIGGFCTTPIQYVAMGDSFSSGEGVDPYEGGTNIVASGFPVNLCRRSDLAYPRLLRIPVPNVHPETGPVLSASLGIGGTDLGFVACSGAETENVLFNGVPLGGNPPYIAPDNVTQLNRPEAPTFDTDLITISIGGNDAQFVEVLIGCTLSINCQRDTFFFTGSQPLEQWLTAEIDGAVRSRVRAVVDEILSGPMHSGTAVALVGYPHIVAEQECNDLRFFDLLPGPMPNLPTILEITQEEQAFFNRATTRMNEMLQEVASEKNLLGSQTVLFVDPRPEFASRGICTASGTPFFFPLVTRAEPSLGSGTQANPDRKNGFHPNELGHQAYSRAVGDAISVPGVLQP